MPNLKTLTLLAALAGGALLLGQSQAAGEPRAKTKRELAASFPGIAEENVGDSPVPGLYELTLGTHVAYVSQDGRYLIKGEIIDLEASVNLTEVRRVSARRKILQGLDPEAMIVFSPSDPDKIRHTVTVFTDIDCSYCRMLHQNIRQMNALGVEVRYLMYPRSGPGTPAWQKAADVWCARDRNSALTAAKSDKPFDTSACDATPVAEQYELAGDLGLRGTPAILSEGGDYLGGYLAPKDLLNQLEMAVARTPGTH